MAKGILVSTLTNIICISGGGGLVPTLNFSHVTCGVWPGVARAPPLTGPEPGMARGHTPMLSDHLLLLSSHPAQLPPGASGDKSWSQPLLRSWDQMSSDGTDKWVRQPRQWGDREHEIIIIVSAGDHEIIITPVTLSDQDECYHARGQ